MTSASTLGTPALPTLPHWETPPADLQAAIREIKAALRARIAASGRTVEEVFAVIEARVAERVAEIAAEKERGETVWPVIDYADIEAGTVTADALAKLHRRGCLIVRGHFPHEQATAWDQGIVDYVESNRFFENYRGPGDDFFGSVGSKPEIYPVYWSPAQMQARQSDRMARVQTFLNSQWRSESDGVQWFDPDRDSLYPDRIRRRPPGADSGGLGTHLDPGTLDLWMTQATRRRSGTCSTAPSSSTTPGTPPTAPPARSTPAPPCARRSAPSRAGPRSPTWTTTRASCTPSPSPRPWAISCSARYWPTCPTTTCAVSPSTRSSPPTRSGTPCSCRPSPASRTSRPAIPSGGSAT